MVIFLQQNFLTITLLQIKILSPGPKQERTIYVILLQMNSNLKFQKSKQGFDYIKSIIVINPYGLRFRYNRVENKSLSTNLEIGLELNSGENSSKLTIDNPSESTLFGILVSCSMPFQLRFAGDTIGSNPSFKVGKGTDVPSKYERQGLHYVALDSAIYPTSKIAPGKSLTIPLNFEQLDQSQNDLKCYVNHIFSAKIQG